MGALFPRTSSFDAELHGIAAALRQEREAWRARQQRSDIARFPLPGEVADAVEHISAALYPFRLGGVRGAVRGTESHEDAFVADQLRQGLSILKEQVAAELDYWQSESAHPFEPDQAETIVRHFATTLPEVRALIDSDIEAAFLGDPAAKSAFEILVSYPGAQAILHHRLAHELHKLGAVIVARIVSALANARTGIDIHPGAAIGPRFFIDHGTGVVIGETAVVGADVKLYQHVTLGARSALGVAEVSARERFARHPIVEDDVVIYAGATILGRVTIGRGSVIGGNVWLLEDVPPGSVVTQPEAVRLNDEAARGVAETLTGRAG